MNNLTLQDNEINFSLTGKLKPKTKETDKNIEVYEDDKEFWVEKALEFTLNLNPLNKRVKIEDALSTPEALIKVFKRILNELEEIKEHTERYSNVMHSGLAHMQKQMKAEIRKDGKNYFSDEALRGLYDQNLIHTFEKIDRIVFESNSPGLSSVSFATSYNGDRRPK